MKNWGRNSVIGIIILILAGSLFSLNADLSYIAGNAPELIYIEETPQDVVTDLDDEGTDDEVAIAPQPVDTTPPLFPIAPVIPQTYQDLNETHPIDFRQPSNLNNDFEYNPETNRYELRSKIGGTDVVTPISLTPTEYLNYTLQNSMNSYFYTRNKEDNLAEEGGGNSDDALSMFDFNFDLGPAEKLFGPGGVKVQAQGSALIKMGMNHNKSGNPTLSEKQRNKLAFDFDTQIQTSINASVGDKINFDLNYNTEATFDFDNKNLKLAYVGKEDEIIKVLEAGNVSMNTTNSLIRGGASLFGIKTELQFGKLTVGAVFSQQETQASSTRSKGNIQTTPFEITADSFDENMHYFLSHYFREKYDKSMSTLPTINSGVKIESIEVWVTNKRSNYDEARNIVAFADLGECDSIGNTSFATPIPGKTLPENQANGLYQKLISTYTSARDKSSVTSTFPATVVNGLDYEKVENARKLNTSEYKLNESLGYISLRTRLQPDEVLAVAYRYTYNGVPYQVGELSTDKTTGNTSDNLYLKLIKGTNISPSAYTWNLMMRNVYTISSRSIEKDKFRLDIKYQNDTTGVYLNYIEAGNITNIPLLRVMNLDRLDSRLEARADGFFDYVEGQTVYSDLGKIIFPVVEPFGKHLRLKIGNNTIADNYVYQELYDTTLTVARQAAEKNKFVLTGEYKGSGGSKISLGGFNIPRGSVSVYANGTLLTENVDYVINYNMGEVDIINDAYANANITTNSESMNGFNMQRKTMMGLNLSYAFSPKFNIGATIMNLSEMPITLKSNLGEESINNTIFGFNTNYSTQSYWLTNLLDKIPLLELTAPSQITLSAEYAQLIPGHYKSEYGGDYSYIDDFETAKMTIDLRSSFPWKLSATPSVFPESKTIDDVASGNNRALLAWYSIDPLFTRRSSITPTHIKNDLDQLSNHYVREVYEYELFPDREARQSESSTLPVFNLAFYPKERGPYNVDVNGGAYSAGMNSDGTLANPESRWGGIYRKLESSQTDFEAQNIEYIEFWLLDPFIYEPNSKGGDLYINLGDVSEDVLKDGNKFFENGIPLDGDTTKFKRNAWGIYPTMQSLNYAFDTQEDNLKKQDVGLNGLSTDQEFDFLTYKNYIDELRGKLDPDVIARMENDQFSPLRDPAGDNYHYYRGSDYDREKTSILARYKRYNGVEGNTVGYVGSNKENYNTSAQTGPDVEDINQDNTLNEKESYYPYKISINPDNLKVGSNFIVDKREASPLLKNGKTEKVNWYQFKIPIKEYNEDVVGGIQNFSSIRFIRMYMTGFADSTVLRFGTLQLVRGDWRTYTKDLAPNSNSAPTGLGSINISTVNLEENGGKEPVNYVMPPGVNRMIDPGQPQLRMENEQSLAITVKDLDKGDSRAIYKNHNLDTRQYKRLQMFVHAEKLIDGLSDLHDNELSVFLRLGSDYKNNYYEYEIPLSITPPGRYGSNSTSDRQIVWPDQNMFDFEFELLTDLKLKRNKEKRKDGSTINYYTPYSEYDPDKPMNKITVMGNPTLSEVKVLMVGIRNNSPNKKDVEIWVNEMRLTDFNEDGGWAANVNLYVGLSDLGSINFTGRKETAGFGSLDQGIMDRNMDDFQSVSIATQMEFGKFFPEKAKVSIPVYFAYNEEKYDPKYNPLDPDILLKDALDAAATKQERDSILDYAQDKVTNKSLEINNVRVNITSKNPMPYDPANFTLGYSFNERNLKNATTKYERQTDTRLLFSYSYSPMLKPWEPFNRNKSKRQSGSNPNRSNPNTRPPTGRGGKSGTNFFRDIGIGLLPKNIAINSDIKREYYELQLRNLAGAEMPVSVREDFYWNRDLSIQWDLTKNLSLDLKTGTEARIETPNEQVNKKFEKEKYEIWKDSVSRSIRDWGTPMHYRQQFSARYNIPFKNIPILNFINAGLSYNASYEWNRSALVETISDTGDTLSYNIGNSIKNTRTLGIENVNINLMNFYSKSKFLDEANKKFSMKTNNSRQGNRSSREDRQQKTDAEKLKKKYEGEVTLNLDSTTLVKHSLDNKRIRVTARGADGKLYEVKYKKKDNNTIEIKTKDTVQLKLTITQKPPLSDEWWYKPAQVAARGLMMVRSVGFSYNQTNGMYIPGYKPEIGDFFGQGNHPLGMQPGLDFAFGLTDESYLDKLLEKDLLVRNSSMPDLAISPNPALYNKEEVLNMNALLEPIVGLKINLTATRSYTTQNQYNYMYDNPTTRRNGSFNMTTIAMRGIFNQGDANNGYASKEFDNFLANRKVIAQRLEKKYAGVRYPDGTVYNPSSTPVDENSIDVLVPSFFAAYTGKSASSTPLDLIPSLFKLLPNWNVSYEGLIQIPVFQKYFKSFVIDHAYKGRYSIGSFSSFPSWEQALGTEKDLGFIPSITDENTMIPSSPYDITSVSIAEGFDPLFKITSTFLNNMSLNVNYRIIRTVNLNISSYQIVEQNETAWTVGTGYRFENFNKVLGLRKTGGQNFNNELRLSADVTFSKKHNLIRKIQEEYTQATQGDSQLMIKFSADYNLSKMITLQAYFDRQMSNPLVSSSAYPFTKTDFGISLRINFTR